jgi:hypothetical protein
MTRPSSGCENGLRSNGKPRPSLSRPDTRRTRNLGRKSLARSANSRPDRPGMFTSANSISMPSSLANCPRASVAERAVSVSHPSSSSIEAISSRVRGSSSATMTRRGIGTTGMAGSTSYLPHTPMPDSRLSSWMDDVIFLPRRSRQCALASEFTLSKRLPACAFRRIG